MIPFFVTLQKNESIFCNIRKMIPFFVALEKNYFKKNEVIFVSKKCEIVLVWLVKLSGATAGGAADSGPAGFRANAEASSYVVAIWVEICVRAVVSWKKKVESDFESLQCSSNEVTEIFRCDFTQKVRLTAEIVFAASRTGAARRGVFVGIPFFAIDISAKIDITHTLWVISVDSRINNKTILNYWER